MKFPFKNTDVALLFDSYPPQIRRKLMILRDLIFHSAKATPGVGAIEETLRWGQPSYLTPETNSGSIIRIDRVPHKQDEYAIYFHCQTNLITTFRFLYPDTFTFKDNRCIVFTMKDKVPKKKLAHCITLALTYHLKKTMKLS